MSRPMHIPSAQELSELKDRLRDYTSNWIPKRWHLPHLRNHDIARKAFIDEIALPHCIQWGKILSADDERALFMGVAEALTPSDQAFMDEWAARQQHLGTNPVQRPGVLYDEDECGYESDASWDYNHGCSPWQCPLRKDPEKKRVGHCGGCYAKASRLSLCSRCQNTAYCSKECQTKQWSQHKLSCFKSTYKRESGNACKNEAQGGEKDMPVFSETFEADSFELGEAVIVANLKASPQYNGLRAKVERLPSSTSEEGRFRVRLVERCSSEGLGALKSELLAVRAANLRRSCCVDGCGSPAQAQCGRCKLRLYCGRRCCEADWKEHKRYCRAPPALAAAVADFKKGFDEVVEGRVSMGTPMPSWDDFRATASAKQLESSRSAAKAKPLSELEALEESLVELLHSVLPEGALAQRKRVKAMGQVSLRADPFLSSLRALPTTSTSFTLSFSAVTVARGSGQLLYSASAMDDGPGLIRAGFTVHGRPTVCDLEKLAYLALAEPDPCGMPDAICPGKPLVLVVAHRWGQAAAEAIRKPLANVGVAVEFESAAEAERSCASAGTDPDGLNVAMAGSAAGKKPTSAPTKKSKAKKQKSTKSKEGKQASPPPPPPPPSSSSSSSSLSAAAAAVNDDDDDGPWRSVGFPEDFGPLDDDPGDEDYARSSHPAWEFHSPFAGWQRYPPRLECGFERMQGMGAPHFLYRPGDPSCDGLYDSRFQRTTAGPASSVNAPPPAGVATRRVSFQDMAEVGLYTGGSRPIRRTGEPRPHGGIDWDDLIPRSHRGPWG